MSCSAEVNQMRNKYYEVLHLASKHKLQKVLMKQKWVNIMIQRVMAAKEIAKAEGLNNLHEYAKQALDNYDVINIDNQQTLILKTAEPPSEKVVVALEDSFEIVLKSHLFTGHGNYTAMNKWLSDANYTVSVICTPVLYGVCHNCLLGTRDTDQSIDLPYQDVLYSSLAMVNIIDMSMQPDKSFHYLLVYQELQTQFVQLRPLIAQNLVEETSMELMKMFCDFSSPACLIVKSDLKQIFEAVLDRLNVVFMPKISLKISEENRNMASIVIMEVEDKLTKWMMRHDCNVWSVGCHIVQWEMNNIRTEGGSPFEKFFGLTRKTPERMPNVAQKKTLRKLPTKAKETEPKATENDCNNKIRTSPKSIEDNSNPISEIQDRVPSNPISPISSTHRSHSIQSESSVVDVMVKSEPENEEEAETHICCTCNAVMRTHVYFCCVCKQSLHLYCGARKQSANGVVENICFICVNP